MFSIGGCYIDNSNILEMRKLDLVTVGEELYEVIRKFPYQKFNKDIDGEAASLIRDWVGCEKILKSNQTNEYLCVNLIQEVTPINVENDKL